MEDTIVAISTALGVGAISIVRLSGKDAIEIVNNCFEGKDLTKVNSHTINYGYIKNDEEIIDEVLVSVMKEPRTYTKENIVEINCHGGIIATNKILETMLENGARLAEPGEFTKRAFLNGRIDLVESESVMDLIESKSDEARSLAISSLKGNISNLIEEFRDNLKQLLSQIEVNIDYPEYYDIEVVTKQNIRDNLDGMKNNLNRLIKESKNTLPVKEGIKTVILGRPNVGKSSLLNALLNEDKAIVTEVAGTTRDIVEGEILLDGILLKMIDTAGIRKTANVVESIGVEKSLSLIKDADLVIVVLNNNEKLTKEDQEILEKTKHKPRIVVVNKVDLKTKLKLKEEIDNIITTSTIKNLGIEELKDKIKELFNIEQIKTKDYTYLSNSRQISLARRAYKELKQAEEALDNNVPIDMVEIDLKDAFDTLGEIIGETYSEEIIDNLFKNFCVGK
ncbi:MAG: tRNA uridine-5-carboxymethylaminomethyl(34) synthesis GTPase MnmE [Bacilli bacterium]|nr:tRNA uridine-5-carboxymethylaminomethyl(34) synthesis GTPase MnmE [Bacilli bacterium]MBQ6538680.1 tRNA uridine-5-carboxymethylaminomethyl(34) synthesis GTPase MnmE [Bacilli bacterium]